MPLNIFSKKTHHRCLTGSWICLWAFECFLLSAATGCFTLLLLCFYLPFSTWATCFSCFRKVLSKLLLNTTEWKFIFLRPGNFKNFLNNLCQIVFLIKNIWFERLWSLRQQWQRLWSLHQQWLNLIIISLRAWNYKLFFF